jgi:hypothetical protein
MTTVWIYVDTNKEVGDVDHLKVFASPDLAQEWFKENDPEGVAFEYVVMRRPATRRLAVRPSVISLCIARLRAA